MQLRSLHFFKFTKYSHLSEVLTLNDVLYWGGDTFASVILALFVIQFLEGATASTVGIAYLIYRLASSLTTIQVGLLFDRHKGYQDEIWGLFGAGILAGLTYMALSFSSQVWHLYVAMAIIGVCRSFDINSWKLLFYSHLEKNMKGRAMGTYDAIYGISIGVMGALAGFIGEAYGFRIVILVAGLFIFVGAFPTLSLRTDKAV